MSPQIAIGEAIRIESEDRDRGEQRMDARITESERRGSLIADDEWLRDAAKGVLADGGIVGDALDGK